MTGKNQAMRENPTSVCTALPVWRTVQKGLLFIMHPVQLEELRRRWLMKRNGIARCLPLQDLYTTEHGHGRAGNPRFKERYCCVEHHRAGNYGKAECGKMTNVIKNK